MKTTLAVLALCVCAPGALAAAPECRVIENANARLSCYDATYPPKIGKVRSLLKKTRREPPTRIPSAQKTPGPTPS